MSYTCVIQCDLFADDGTLNTVNDNIDLQQSLYMIPLDGFVEIDGTESDENKMHVDGDETKNIRKNQLPLNLKSETTPIEQVSKHRLLGVTVHEQLKWQHQSKLHIYKICRTVSRRKKIFFRK